jgi:hypothetical protein
MPTSSASAIGPTGNPKLRITLSSYSNAHAHQAQLHLIAREMTYT